MGLAARQIYPDAHPAPRLELQETVYPVRIGQAEVRTPAIARNRRRSLFLRLLSWDRRRPNTSPQPRLGFILTFAKCSLCVLLILPVEGRHSGWLLFGRGRNGVPAGPAQPAGLPGRLGHRSMGTMTCAQGACWTTGRRLRTGRQTTARGSEARSHEHRGGAPKGAGPRSQGDPDTPRTRVGPFAAAHGASQTPAPFGAPLPS